MTWGKVAAQRRLPAGTAARSSSGGGMLGHDGEVGDGFGQQQSVAFRPALSASDTGAAAARLQTQR
jgi:hypothetical protein